MNMIIAQVSLQACAAEIGGRLRFSDGENMYIPEDKLINIENDNMFSSFSAGRFQEMNRPFAEIADSLDRIAYESFGDTLKRIA